MLHMPMVRKGWIQAMLSETGNCSDSKLEESPEVQVPERILGPMGFCELAEIRAEVRGDTEGHKRPVHEAEGGYRKLSFSARVYPIICTARRKGAKYYRDMCTSSHFTKIGMRNKSLKRTNRLDFQAQVSYDF